MIADANQALPAGTSCMNAGSGNILKRKPAGDARDEPLPAEKFLPLLQAVLARVRRARDTPLQFGIDSEEIVSAALREFHDGLAGAQLVRWQDWLSVKKGFHQLVTRSLQAERAEPEAAEPLPAASQSPPENGAVKVATADDLDSFEKNAAHPLADWLDQFHTVMSEIQPRAIEIVTLRVEGFQDRDIAERLGLGLRLVRRIVRDLRASWEAVTGRE